MRSRLLNSTSLLLGPSRRREKAAVNSNTRQRGATLLVALIMLILLTMIAVSAINSSSSGIQTVGNTQFREEATAVAQQAIDQVISLDFTSAPAAVSYPVDINQDGNVDYTASVAKPTCTSTMPLTDIELAQSSAANATCLGSDVPTTPAIVGPSGPVGSKISYCYKQTWDVKSTVADNNTGANVTVHQGVFTRVQLGTQCP